MLILLGIVLGMMTTCLTIILAVGMVAYTGLYLHSFSVFFIIPLGALVSGGLCGSGVYGILFLAGRKPTFVHHLVAVFLGACGFVGIYYGLYATAYVTPDMKINHMFQGEHISNFVYSDTGEPVTFASFIMDEVRSRTTTVLFRVGGGAPSIVPRVGLGSTINWIDFGIEVIGFLLGSTIGGGILSERKHCARCQRYMREWTLFSVILDNLPATVSALDNVLTSGVQYREFIKRVPSLVPPITEPHARFDMVYCPRCYEGFLLIRFMRKKSDGSFEEVENYRKTIALHADVVRQVIVREPAKEPV